MKSLFYALAALGSFTSTTSNLPVKAAGEYTLRISRIDMRKTPQSGDWRAGATIYQGTERDNDASWCGGESKFEGSGASLPVNLEISGLSVGEEMGADIRLDDDAEDACGDKAEDKLSFKFKVFASSQDKVKSFASGDWAVGIHYTLTK